MGFISRKAKLGSVLLLGDVIVLGPSKVDDNSVIMHGSILGFPTRSKIIALMNKLERGRHNELSHIDLLEDISEGCTIGRRCVVRTNCIIYERVTLGSNCELGHNVLIREDTVIGDNTRVGSGTIIEGQVRIGSNVNIQSNVYIPRQVIIEDNVFIGPCVTITNDKYPPSRRIVPTIIRRGAIIGARSIILPGVEIGENAVVGAGSVVTKSVPPRTVVFGVPARPAYSYEEYIRKRSIYEMRYTDSQ